MDKNLVVFCKLGIVSLGQNGGITDAYDPACGAKTVNIQIYFSPFETIVHEILRRMNQAKKVFIDTKIICLGESLLGT